MGQAAQWEDTDWEIIPQREGAFAYSPTSNITVAYDGVMIKIREAQLGPASIMADRVTVDAIAASFLPKAISPCTSRDWYGEANSCNTISRPGKYAPHPSAQESLLCHVQWVHSIRPSHGRLSDGGCHGLH